MLCQDLLDRFTLNFHHILGIDRRLPIWPSFFDLSKDIAMATNFRVKTVEIGQLTFIRHLGIPKRIGISQFRFQVIWWDDLLHCVQM